MHRIFAYFLWRLKIKVKLKYGKEEVQLALPQKNISNSPEKIKEMFGENIVSAYKFINHNCDNSHLKDLGNLKSDNKLWGNPLHEEMQGAAEKVGVDFNINVVINEHHEIIEEDIIINI